MQKERQAFTEGMKRRAEGGGRSPDAKADAEHTEASATRDVDADVDANTQDI